MLHCLEIDILDSRLQSCGRLLGQSPLNHSEPQFHLLLYPQRHAGRGNTCICKREGERSSALKTEMLFVEFTVSLLCLEVLGSQCMSSRANGHLPVPDSLSRV